MNDLTLFNKLTDPAKRGKYQFVSVAKTKDEIDSILKVYTVMTAVTAFSVGERLVILKEQLEHGKFLKYIEKEFTFSYSTATRYMRLFEHYKDDPAEMEKYGLTKALMNAGIIKPKEQKTTPYLEDEHFGEKKRTDELASVLMELFEKPPSNPDAKIKNHRLTIMGNQIYVIDKYYHNPFSLVQIDLPGQHDPRIKKHANWVREGVQKILEKYYEQIELCEHEDDEELKSRGIKVFRGPPPDKKKKNSGFSGA
jgi:hypothetical protein